MIMPIDDTVRRRDTVSEQFAHTPEQITYFFDRRFDRASQIWDWQNVCLHCSSLGEHQAREFCPAGEFECQWICTLSVKVLLTHYTLWVWVHVYVWLLGCACMHTHMFMHLWTHIITRCYLKTLYFHRFCLTSFACQSYTNCQIQMSNVKYHLD